MGVEGKGKTLDEFTLPPSVADYFEQRFRELGKAVADIAELVKPMAKEVAEIHAQGGMRPAKGVPVKKNEEKESHPLLLNLVPEYAPTLEVLDDGDVIKARKWLGESWTPINELLEGAGYEWIRDGRKSRWEKKAPQ